MLGSFSASGTCSACSQATCTSPVCSAARRARFSVITFTFTFSAIGAPRQYWGCFTHSMPIPVFQSANW